MALNKTVFVVDDERTIADTLALIIERSGFHSTAFYSAEDALMAIEKKVPDLVISDVVMPNMTGIDLCLRLRINAIRAKCILLSGQAYTSVLLEEARHKGHDFEILSKPIPPRELLKRIESELA